MSIYSRFLFTAISSSFRSQLFMDTRMSRSPRTFARVSVLTRVNESDMVILTNFLKIWIVTALDATENMLSGTSYIIDKVLVQ